MIILGVNFGHDASITIIKEGKILASIEEEKVSRVKQDFGWPEKAINRLFFEYGICKSDIDLICLDSMILDELSLNEIEFRFSKKDFQKKLEYINRITSYLNISKRKINNLESKKRIQNILFEKGYINANINYYEHHLSHAASVYYTSPIDLNLIITSDGMGGNSSFNFYVPKKNELELIRTNNYKASIGGFYSMITKLLGFRPTRHEGKITGLAAFGKETELVNIFLNLWKYDNEKLTRYPFDNLEEEWEKFSIEDNLSISEKINYNNSSGYISNDYSRRNLVLLNWLKENTLGFSKEDIAYACQKVAETITLNEIKKIINDNNFKNVKVGLSGGVFANVRINQLIYELEKIDNIFIHPAMGDSGLALGNAVLGYINHNSKLFNQIYFPIVNTFLGPNYSSDLKKFVENFSYANIEMKKMNEPAKEVANLLFENKIIGLWNGRLEWGPRALGSRSIILNTFDKNVNDTLNKRLNRTEFMPFAPVVLDKCAKMYFPKYNDKVPAADYMTITYDTAEEYHDLLQATVHVDGTARPQVINAKDTPYYYSILDEFYKLSDCGAMVNTSFNAHEEPILSTPETAINALLNKRVDFLVMEDYLFSLK